MGNRFSFLLYCNRGWIYFGLLFFFSIFLACSSIKQTEIKTADELYILAKKKFDSGDFEGASKYFDLLKLQFPASQYADEAQFYIAEISYERGEYIMAAFHYNWLRRSFSNTPFYKESLFKTAMCYYNLSPTFDRDQEYTFKAIDAFNDFIVMYPKDSLAVIASKYLKDLKNKLAYRNYHISLIYYKMRSYLSSLIYLDEIFENYPDSDCIEDAYWIKIISLKNLNRFLDAIDLIEKYKEIFPNGKYISQIITIENELNVRANNEKH